MGSNRLKLFIRTDANASIATGHLYRCMAIAEAVCKLGGKESDASLDTTGPGLFDVEFIFGDPESLTVFNSARSISDVLRDSNCAEYAGVIPHSSVMSTKILTSYDKYSMESEIPEMIEILKGSCCGVSDCISDSSIYSLEESKIGTDRSENNLERESASNKPILLIDSYSVTERYLRALSDYAYIACIDDLRNINFEYDLVVNYDYVNDRNRSSYEASYSRAKRSLLGLAYTPLRAQFAVGKDVMSASESVRTGCGSAKMNTESTMSDATIAGQKAVLISSGGSDPEHALLKITEELADISDLRLHLLVGKMCGDRDELLELASRNPNITIHENVKNMASLLSQMDVAVSAAGTTLYELCARGVPAISFSFADNQVPGAESFAEAGVIPYAGDMRNKCDVHNASGIRNIGVNLDMSNARNTKDATNVIKEYIVHLDSESALRQSEAMRKLIDGQGSERIAKELLNIVK